MVKELLECGPGTDGHRRGTRLRVGMVGLVVPLSGSPPSLGTIVVRPSRLPKRLGHRRAGGTPAPQTWRRAPLSFCRRPGPRVLGAPPGTRLCTSVSVFVRKDVSPFQVYALWPVTERNCVAAKRGGEQRLIAIFISRQIVRACPRWVGYGDLTSGWDRRSYCSWFCGRLLPPIGKLFSPHDVVYKPKTGRKTWVCTPWSVDSKEGEG